MAPRWLQAQRCKKPRRAAPKSAAGREKLFPEIASPSLTKTCFYVFLLSTTAKGDERLAWQQEESRTRPEAPASWGSSVAETDYQAGLPLLTATFLCSYRNSCSFSAMEVEAEAQTPQVDQGGVRWLVAAPGNLGLWIPGQEF